MEKAITYIKKAFEKLNQEPAPQVKPVKVPMFGMLFTPYTLLIDNFRKFAALALIYGLIDSAVILLAGQGYMCGFPDFRGYCSASPYAYGLSYLFSFFITVIFASRWYNYSFKSVPLSFDFLFKLTGNDLRSAGVFVVILAVNLVPMLSLYLLYIRVPNPDWRIEMVYFAFVSIGFVLPFLAMRLYSMAAFVFAGEPLPPVREVWKRSSASSFRIVMSYILIFIFSIVSLFVLHNNFRLAAGENAIYINTVSEIAYQLVRLAIIAFLVNSCYAQKFFLFERVNENGN